MLPYSVTSPLLLVSPSFSTAAPHSKSQSRLTPLFSHPYASATHNRPEIRSLRKNHRGVSTFLSFPFWESNRHRTRYIRPESRPLVKQRASAIIPLHLTQPTRVT